MENTHKHEKTDFTWKESFKHIYKMAEDKSSYAWWKVLLLGLMGGMFIGIGYIGDIAVQQAFREFDITSGKYVVSGVGKGLGAFLGAGIFPVGLMLCVFLGGNLFTSDVLSSLVLFRKPSQKEVGKVFANWGIVWLGNFVGAFLIALITYWAQLYSTHNGAARSVAFAFVQHKSSIAWWVAMGSGVLCNLMVAGAIMMTKVSKGTISKIFLIWFPITLFVLAGFQHVVANMFVFSMGWLYFPGEFSTFDAIFNNLIPTTVGNFLAGGVILPLMYTALSGHFSKKAH